MTDTDPVRPPLTVELTDGSVWPRPAMESDDYNGVGWILRYSTPSRGDLLMAAWMVEAYGILVAETTQRKRDLVCREIRAALTDTDKETDQ